MLRQQGEGHASMHLAFGLYCASSKLLKKKNGLQEQNANIIFLFLRELNIQEISLAKINKSEKLFLGDIRVMFSCCVYACSSEFYYPYQVPLAWLTTQLMKT